MVTNTGSANLEKERWRLKLNEQEWTVSNMQMVKGIVCVIQLICLYHVLKHDRTWLVPIQVLIACAAICM